MQKTNIGLAVLFVAGCSGGSSGTNGTDASHSHDGATSDGVRSDGGIDANPRCPTPPRPTPTLSRGLRWVRENPTFISGLMVRMGNPPASFVNEYYDTFGANAAHLWQDGLPNLITAWRTARPTARWLSWVEANGTGTNGQVLGGYPANVPGRIGYQVSDEPRTTQQLDAMGQGAAAIRAADPNALIVFNYTYAADGIEGMLDRAAAMYDHDIISHDDYSASRKVYGHLDIFRKQALADNRAYWAYLNSYYGNNTHDFQPAESDMRWNAFSHALYGFTGFSWFVYQITQNNEDLIPTFFDATGSYSANPTTTRSRAATINRELLNLQRSMSQLRSTDVRYNPVSSIAQPVGTQRWSAGAGGDRYIESITSETSGSEQLMGFFKDDYGDGYVMIMNPNHQNADLISANNNAQTIRVNFNFAAAGECLDRTRVRSLNKVTGAVVDLPLIDDGGGKAHLVVTLAAGDPVLFKYANEIPFAMATW